MKRLALALGLCATAAAAQSPGQVRVEPGFFCAQNKCLRFSGDLTQVSVQGRRPADISNLNLAQNPVIPAEEFDRIFYRALNQGGVNGNRG